MQAGSRQNCLSGHARVRNSWNSSDTSQNSCDTPEHDETTRTAEARSLHNQARPIIDCDALGRAYSRAKARLSMSYRFVAVFACSVGAAGACHSDDGGGRALPDAPMAPDEPDAPDDQAALQALLHDGALPVLPVADQTQSTVSRVGAADA